MNMSSASCMLQASSWPLPSEDFTVWQTVSLQVFLPNSRQGSSQFTFLASRTHQGSQQTITGERCVACYCTWLSDALQAQIRQNQNLGFRVYTLVSSTLSLPNKGGGDVPSL